MMSVRCLTRLLLFCSVVGFSWAREASTASTSVRRRLGQDRWCPSDSIYHCDDPGEIIDDDTVDCDWDTCLWDLDLLDANEKPQLCQAIEIKPEAIDNWPDTLEPCLLWEMLYGQFQPTASPTTSIAPTPAPTTASPSAVPSSTPSVSPRPTTTPSSLPIGVASDEPTTFGSQAPSPVPTSIESDMPSSVPSAQIVKDEDTTITFDTVLINLFVAAPPVRRRHLQTLDRAELFVLTRDHLLEQLRREYGSVESVDLVLTAVKSQTLTDGASVETEAVDGKVTFASPDSLPRSFYLQQQIEQAFEGQERQEYLTRLQQSNDAALQRTYDLYVGLPSDLDLNVQNPTASKGDPQSVESSGNESSGNESIFGFEWNAMWISVFAVASACVAGLLIVAILLCRRCCCQKSDLDLRQTRTKGSGETGSDDDSAQAHGPDVEPTGHSGEESGSDDGADQHSEVTSVYSYIESSTVADDNTYSVAPSFNYNVDVNDVDDGDIESVQSRSNMWSVMSGLDGLGETSDVDAPERKGNSPTRMIVSARKLDGRGEMMIFSDEEEDDLSMLSDRPLLHQSIAMDTDVSPIKKPVAMYHMTSGEMAADDDQSETTDEEGITGRLLPFGSLSRVEESREGSKNSNSSAGSSSRKKSLEDSSRTSNSSTGSGSSQKENACHNSRILDTSSEAVSLSSDDDSLFMGPDLTKYSKIGEDESVMTLSSQDKVLSFSNDDSNVSALLATGNVLAEAAAAADRSDDSNDARDEFRILSRGNETLTDKEKQHLGLNRKPLASEDEEEKSIQLPTNYSIQDDVTVSTAGESNHGKYPIASMASF